MAQEGATPARDDRSAFDYQREHDSVPDGLAPLPGLVDGEVRFDDYTKQLYATDASIYEATPIAVVFPRHTDDVSEVLGHCWVEEIPVLPRGAGTSLAGQAVNEAVVMDFTRHMGELTDLDVEAQTARAQPGIVLATLDEALADDRLQFAPDPAWGDKSTLGGAIGNNSTGAHSLHYGKTDDYLESCEVVLADGSVAEFGWVDVNELGTLGDPDGTLEERIYATVDRVVSEEATTIEQAYPDTGRNVAGYNLDALVEDAEQGRVNVAKLFAGSEGTLGVVTAAAVGLEPIPPETAVALLTYESLTGAMADVAPILAHDPAAVEVIDDVLLDLAAETEAFGPLVDILPAGTEAVLLVECAGDDPETVREQLEGVIADRRGEHGAFDAMTAYEPAEQKRFWQLRKSGLPILLSRTTDEKHIAFVEDTAVPAESLPGYVADVQQLFADHDTFASFYGHAGPGCLHIRPLLNTKTKDGVNRMGAIAHGVSELAVEYGGTVAGEHGNGRARTQWLEAMYGAEVVELFGAIKRACDPRELLNPGQIYGDLDMTRSLRFDPSYAFSTDFEPTLEWENANGFQGMVELCHGCGGCRGEQSTTGGVMCPTYRASAEEITTTRGRANLLRQALSGNLPAEEVFTDEFLTEVLDLCIGCKGCARDCPSEVDMAKLKAELTHEYRQRNGSSLRDRLFADIDRVAALGSATAPVSNWLNGLPGGDWILERVVGIAAERGPPTFARKPFTEWFGSHEPTVEPTRDTRVLLYPDTYTNYIEPSIGRAATEVYEAAGFEVDLARGVGPSGRAAYSLGFLDRARARAQRNVVSLRDQLDENTRLVALEPADAVMFQSDYASLLAIEEVETIADRTMGAMQLLDELHVELPVEAPETRITYHGHCHQKATERAHHAANVLSATGFEVVTLDSGCCGMAGSFGYEAEHYAMSKAIGRILYEQVDEAAGEAVTAPGASCRTQLADHLGSAPRHPIEFVADRLVST